jgi:pimeloyl-ACP methyl ester carboxylesterase
MSKSLSDQKTVIISSDADTIFEQISAVRSKWKKWTFLTTLAGGVAASLALRNKFDEFDMADDITNGHPLDFPEHESVEFKTSTGAVLSVSIFKGKGNPIVLSHGWTENQKLWSCLVRELLKDNRYVITYDHQGHGDSSIGNLGLTIDAIAQDLSDLIEGLNLENVILVGHSMGGMTAQYVMVNKPAKTRVSALLLVATAASAVPMATLAKLPAVSGQVVSLLRSTLLEEAFLNDSIGMLLVSSAHGKKPPKAQLLATRDMFLATQKEARSDFVIDMSNLNLIDKLESIKVPTIIMVGTRDTLTPIFLSKQIHVKIKDSILIKLLDRGHMLPFESFVDLKEAIDDLIRLSQPKLKVAQD